jgi:hypothetical protein
VAWSVGLLAVYTNKLSPELVLCPKDFLCAASEDTAFISKNEALIFIKKYVQLNRNRFEVPYCVIDLNEKKFTFIRMANATSYSVEELAPKKFKLIEKYKNEGYESFNGKIIDLDDREWFGIKELDRFNKVYIRGSL